jgi:organic hydroperoxide reductase OsmC/OhrA
LDVFGALRLSSPFIRLPPLAARASEELPMSATHHFAVHLFWTGADAGPLRDYDSYSRNYRVDIDGKPSLEGSAAAAFRGDLARHNPEDLLVASLSSCHFLSYAALCARGGVEVRAYEDEASGTMAFDRVRKVMCFQEVTLRPRVRIAPGADRDKALALHARAHRECFIANSVNFPVRHEPSISVDDR